jgi:pimeloyl-ACP methyl ester carboxylesterase
MERNVRMAIPKTTLHINGKLRGSWHRPVIVFVHGLCCDMDEHIFYNGARWFERRGYATFRFNLYDWQPGTRKLKDCTIKTQADDLDLVVRYLRKNGAKTVHVVGHSYGGPTILYFQRSRF